MLGVRYMTLTSTCHTPWADSSFADAPKFDVKHNGLTDFGKVSTPNSDLRILMKFKCCRRRRCCVQLLRGTWHGRIHAKKSVFHFELKWNVLIFVFLFVFFLFCCISFSVISGREACDKRDESAGHDCGFIACISGNNAWCDCTFSGTCDIFSFIRLWIVQFQSERTRPGTKIAR